MAERVGGMRRFILISLHVLGALGALEVTTQWSATTPEQQAVAVNQAQMQADLAGVSQVYVSAGLPPDLGWGAVVSGQLVPSQSGTTTPPPSPPSTEDGGGGGSGTTWVAVGVAVVVVGLVALGASRRSRNGPADAGLAPVIPVKLPPRSVGD